METLFWGAEIELDAEEEIKFEQFLALFMEKNSQINLSAIRAEDDIIEKHFIDSIYVNIFTELYGNVLDLWTGWGFPLIPLAITNPDVEFVGLDSVGKKMRAVNEFIDSLWLTNATTIIDRAEVLGQDPNYREQFDFVVSRATAYLPTLLEYAIPLLKVDGYFIAYKLDDKEELKSAKKALSRLSASIEVVKNYSIQWQARTLVFIKKNAPTQKKYPRHTGLPLKEPIQ